MTKKRKITTRSILLLSQNEVLRLAERNSPNPKPFLVWRPIYPHPNLAEAVFQFVVRGRTLYQTHSESDFIRNVSDFHPYADTLSIKEPWIIQKEKLSSKSSVPVNYYLRYADGERIPASKRMGGKVGDAINSSKKTWQYAMSLPPFAHRYNGEVKRVKACRISQITTRDMSAAGFLRVKEQVEHFWMGDKALPKNELLEQVWNAQFCRKGLHHPRFEDDPFVWLILFRRFCRKKKK